MYMTHLRRISRGLWMCNEWYVRARTSTYPFSSFSSRPPHCTQHNGLLRDRRSLSRSLHLLYHECPACRPADHQPSSHHYCCVLAVPRPSPPPERATAHHVRTHHHREIHHRPAQPRTDPPHLHRPRRPARDRALRARPAAPHAHRDTARRRVRSEPQVRAGPRARPGQRRGRARGRAPGGAHRRRAGGRPARAGAGARGEGCGGAGRGEAGVGGGDGEEDGCVVGGAGGGEDTQSGGTEEYWSVVRGCGGVHAGGGGAPGMDAAAARWSWDRADEACGEGAAGRCSIDAGRPAESDPGGDPDGMNALTCGPSAH